MGERAGQEFASMSRAASIETFLENRAKFPLEELQRYTGRWVAFSSDGCRLVASGADLVELNECLQLAGADLEDFIVECIPGPDAITHASEIG
jgi:hypothetical protein